MVVLAWVGVACATFRPLHPTGPWNVRELERVPAATWGVRAGLVQEVTYAGEPLGGKPTRVFAYLGRPDPGTFRAGRLPAMVLVHGGGGKSFKPWAEHWAKRGYVALAMDLSGNGPEGRLSDGGPDQSDAVKFRDFGVGEVREMWTYHAVSAVILGHSLLGSLPEVDGARIGITGISWGGYLTCIVAGIDHRLKVAVPVYGCGFLGDNSVWKDGALAGMTSDARQRWLEAFDPSRYLAGVRCPILFLNGTSDFAYPLDSYQRSYRLVPASRRQVAVVVDLPHGHIWSFGEVDAFVDAALRRATPLPAVGPVRVEDDGLIVAVRGKVPLKEAALCYTLDEGPWQKRKWQTTPADIDGGRVKARLPAGRPVVAFLAIIDQRGLRVSSEHVTLPAGP
jgi:dienelactone hydrolase